MTKRFNTTLHLACAILMVILCLAATSAPAQDPTPRDIPPGMEDWCGTYADGTPLCYEELMGLIEKHQRWLSLDKEAQRRSYHDRLDLGSQYPDYKYLMDTLDNKTPPDSMAYGADLSGVNLAGCNLQRARLSYCTLDNAILDNINLKDAYIPGVKFYKATLQNSDLTNIKAYNTIFQFADLSHSVLDNGLFSKTDFTESNLSYSSFSNAVFVETLFYKTDISNVVFQNSVFSSPTLYPSSPLSETDFSNVRGLYSVKVPTSGIDALYELLSIFKRSNHISLQRQVTSAIFRTKHEKSTMSKLYYIAFGITSQYGAFPNIAIFWIFIIFLTSLAIYVLTTYISDVVGISMEMIPCNAQTWPHDKLRINDGRINFIIILAFALLNGMGLVKITYRILNKAFPGIIQGQMPTSIGWIRIISSIQTFTTIYLALLFIATKFWIPFQWFI